MTKIIKKSEKQKKSFEIKNFYSEMRAIIKNHIASIERKSDSTQATKQAVMILIFLVFTACKVIDRNHRALEFREQVNFLEWQRADEKTPLPRPYSLEQALLLEEGVENEK